MSIGPACGGLPAVAAAGGCTVVVALAQVVWMYSVGPVAGGERGGLHR